MKKSIYIPLRNLCILLLTLLTCVNVAWAKVQTVNGKTYNVVYMSNNGAGNKSGDDAANAVSGWANAYSKLSKTGGTYEDDWNYNIIVVVGTITINATEANTKGIPATITGVWPWEKEDGTSTITASVVQNGGKLTTNTSARGSRIGADTRFKNVCFNGPNNGRMSLFMHNTMFDTGCVMTATFGTLPTSNGAMDTDTHKAPGFHLMLFSDEHDFTASGQQWTNPEPMTLTIRSGKFGRILSTRIAGTNVNDQIKKRYVVGTPDHPLMAKIDIDFDPSTNTSAFNPGGYKDDIAFLCAGSTQGTVFADMQMDIKRAKIATVVAGSQGNAIGGCITAKLPTSSYFGRATVNVEGESDSDVTIYRYFGACLGRFTGDDASGECKAYFYGHSTLNLIHGTIEQNVFASGGGLSGLRNPNTGGVYDNQHTSDAFIPYQGGSNSAYPYLGIDYNEYNAGKTIVKVKSKLNGEEETIDLADTKIITNISGGIVKGNVYGGSYGYSSEMKVASAPVGAGSLWGNTEINISGGIIGVKDGNGIITGGNVYGGGGGAKSYYNLAAAAKRDDYLTVATVYGNTKLTISGQPTILGNIYGGGAGLQSQEQNSSEDINVNGTTNTYKNLTANEFLDIAKVYGNTNVTIDAADDWEYTGNIYGGGALGAVEGATNVIIKGGIINGNVFGAGEGESGHPNKAKVEGTDNIVTVNIENGAIRENVYGGGNLAVAEANPTINISGGTISQNVYGGGYGAPAVLTGNTTINVTGGTVSKDVYGGGALANVTGSTTVNVSGGTVTQDVYGGGALANVGSNTSVKLTGGTIHNSYGGGLGQLADADKEAVEAIVNGDATVQLGSDDGTTASKVLGSIFGANNVNGTPQGHVKVHVLKTTPRDGQGAEEYDVAAIYGGGNLAAYEPSDATLADKDKNFAEVLIENCGNSIEYVYGGGNAAPVPATQVTIKGANAIDNAFAGGNGAGQSTDPSAPNYNPGADIGYLDYTRDDPAKEYGTGIATINIQGGTIHHVYGGSNTLGYIKDHAVVNVEAAGTCTMDVAELYGGGKKAPGKAAQINITCTGENGKIDNVYGGAHMADLTGDITLNINGGNIGNAFGGNNESGTIDGTITVNVNWDTDACGTNSLNNVYGGGNLAPYKTPDGKDGPTVNLINGTVNQNVFGGGLKATVTGNPTVTVEGGTVTHDVYGGGALADVTGNTTVNLIGGAVGGAYGGALGSAEVAAKVYGDTYVHLDGSKVTETGIFGANNLNGTPTGHVKVHVTRTTHRDGQATPYNQDGTNTNSYDVPAVYGGGNLSAYEPTDDNDYAEVLIENCDNSIDYVYGGGNAAPVPATSVTIYGANAINNAFAGGNGYGVGNPGADVGYKGYYSKGSREEYGTGETDIKIYGGTINNVYGGSNTLGYIRTHAYVEVLNVPDDDTEHNCELHLGEVHAGGNQAEMYCGGSVTLACSEGADVVYAGSSDADIHGDIDLVITSGTFGKVFGGNNKSGNVYGSITINIDETGCWPVMIGELYACGNEAAYSVYGYNDDGSCKTSGSPLHGDPTINLISFTRIGKVFGGGFGETAKVYGNTKVNVDPIKGVFAGKTTAPIYVLNDKDQRELLSEAAALPYGITKDDSSIVIPDEVGSIGTIYGGGNAGAVYGNTEVNIGLKTTNKHVKDKDNDSVEPEGVAVTITGDVFGGGNEAIVSGDTNVKIGENE